MSSQEFDETTLWTPANVVTLVRILLVPVFVVAIISPWPDYLPQWPDAEAWKPWVAAVIFAVLSCTDALDGYLARSRGEVTNFGKFIDPLADKILVAAALLALVELQLLPSWVALLIIAREFIVSGLRMLVATHGIVVAASWYGKAKTVFQIIAILLFIVKGSDLLLSLHPDMEIALYAISWFFMAIALVLTVVSMIDYFVKSAPVLGFGSIGASAEGGVDVPGKSQPSFPTESDISEAAQAVVAEAKDRGLKLSTAESCTGGLIGGALTSVPGSSSVVEGGIISYSNEVKMNVLGVSADDLRQVGAVSAEVASAMALGSRKVANSDIAVSVTGIAGPGGAVPGKPVGTVWFGLADAAGVRTYVRHFAGNREQVRAQTVLFALELISYSLDPSRSEPVSD